MVAYLISANYHTVQMAPEWRDSAAAYDPLVFPQNVVLGFRAIFWKAFTAVHHRPATGELQLVGRTWKLRRLAVLESRHARKRLGIAEDDTVIILSMLIESEGAPENFSLNTELFKAGINEQGFVASVVNGLADDPGLEWLSTLKHNRDFPGRYILQHDKAYGDDVETLSMFSFYYLGLLMFWQIARDQVEISLSGDILEMEKNGDDLLLLRKRIINLDRLFLSSSVSNHPGIRQLSKDCRDKQKLEKRFLRLPELNDRIEKYFEIVSQLSTQREQRMLNVIVFIIAILGLPVSVMSMMLAMTTRAQVLAEPDKLFGTISVQLFLVASVIGSGLALGILAILLTGRKLVRLSRWIRAAYRRKNP
ncbi:hypothetical protein [Brevundimonas sp.]|uniref:hypothetical protein n=1 Tax=Brevundimonas sp. TaxID=1871086 RepID=UPI003D1202F8